MANQSWLPASAIAAIIESDDILKAHIYRDPAFETPVLKLLSVSKSKGYDIACIPLTNDNWRARWKRMCLSPDSVEEKDEDAERLSEAWRSNPAFLKDEVNVTRLGKFVVVVKCGMYLSLESR
jgi:type II protein arginine methyltransferase